MKSWNRRTRDRKGRRRRSAQTLVETALLLTTVLLPITLGSIQYGAILSAQQALAQLSREGGRYAAIHGTESSVDTDVKAYVQTLAATTVIKPADIPAANIVLTSVPSGAARVSGNKLALTITYPMSKKIFLGHFPSWVPGLSVFNQNRVITSIWVIE